MISPTTMNLNVGGNRVGRWSRVKMSALGQKQTWAPHQPMSALPPNATLNATYRNVRFGPKADSCTQQRGRYSITSLALASSVGGTVRPSAFAAFIFNAISNLTGS